MNCNTQTLYTIQEAAERTRLSAHTLRYYERAGLLNPIHRAAGSGHRRYGDDDLRLIELLKKMRHAGMPIQQMQRYVALLQEGDPTIEARRQMLEAHRDTVCERISELQDYLKVIEYKIANYRRLGQMTSDVDTGCNPKEQER